ncbi:hypothetical protein [Acidithiobacillus sp. AMEEHan]|uniref:hypothetical protein n=1 Tax=Acidithiobacillus sp. AMEEHan TaxID=2994951 RepID=UPI0027E496E9|nr:hypothetical protein [Acidithiobacillus sp. AMEEHan]
MAREQILRHIPHAGEMCLLDEVLEWDADTLSAVSQRYQHANNPLRRCDATFGTASAIEIAAQAMALHGALTASLAESPSPGYLVSLRNVHIEAPVLTDALGPLQILVRRHESSIAGARYSFLISAAANPRVSGLAMVIFGDHP